MGGVGELSGGGGGGGGIEQKKTEKNLRDRDNSMLTVEGIKMEEVYEGIEGINGDRRKEFCLGAVNTQYNIR